jgi:hypothetical protein
MRTLGIVCVLSLIPLVAFADPADLPNANLPGNSPSLPNSNLPGSVPDDHPVQLPDTDTTAPASLPAAWWWPFQPTASVRELPPALSPEQTEAIATLQRQLDAMRATSDGARQPQTTGGGGEAAQACADTLTLQCLLPRTAP